MAILRNNKKNVIILLFSFAMTELNYIFTNITIENRYFKL